MNGLIAWFAKNKVAANLLMLIILVAGLLAIVNVRTEVFPEFSADMITVSVPFLGATPEEVEESVARPERPGPARFMPSGQLMDEATVTLALSLEDAVKLTYMANFGQEVRLVIRRYEERETPQV